MTKVEALRFANDEAVWISDYGLALSVVVADKLIDKIYDDFEEQLTAKDKELEYDQRNASKSQEESVMLLDKVKILEEQLDMEKRKAYLDGSNACFKALKEAGKLK